MLHDRHLGGPVCAPAHAVHGDPVLIDLWPDLRVIQHPGQHPVGGLADLDGCLPRAGTIDRKIANTKWKNRAETFGQILFTTVQTVHRNYQRHRAFGVLRKPQVAHDLIALEGNVHHFQRRIEELACVQKCVDSFFIRALLSRRRRNGPASERVELPGPYEIRISLRGITLFQRLGFRHITVRHEHESRGPFVFVAAVNLGTLPYVPGIQPDQRILAVFRAAYGFGLYFVERALAPLSVLSECASGNECEEYQQETL